MYETLQKYVLVQRESRERRGGGTGRGRRAQRLIEFENFRLAWASCERTEIENMMGIKDKHKVVDRRPPTTGDSPPPPSSTNTTVV